MEKIEWWLLKYSDHYKNILHFINSKNEIFELEDGSSVFLPPLEEVISNFEKKFICLYEELDTISKFHRNEKVFEQEMLDYQKIKHSKKALKEWALKNEKLGVEIYVSFHIDYLDYSENAEHLQVYIYSSRDIEIYIDRKDFKNTINFVETFDELYWIQEILPENMKRIN